MLTFLCTKRKTYPFLYIWLLKLTCKIFISSGLSIALLFVGVVHSLWKNLDCINFISVN